MWIVDETQNLLVEPFRVLPPSCTSLRALLGVWLVGHPALVHFLEHGPYTASSVRVASMNAFTV